MENKQVESIEWDGTMLNALRNANAAQEDGASVDFLAGPNRLIGPTTPDQWGSLVMMKQAADDIRNSRITREEFLAKVKILDDMADNGVKLGGVKEVHKMIETLDDEPAQVAWNFLLQAPTLKQGTTLMAAYITTKNVEHLDRGVEMVEKCLAEIDGIPVRAAERDYYRQKNEAEAAAAPQGEL